MSWVLRSSGVFFFFFFFGLTKVPFRDYGLTKVPFRDYGLTKVPFRDYGLTKVPFRDHFLVIFLFSPFLFGAFRWDLFSIFLGCLKQIQGVYLKTQGDSMAIGGNLALKRHFSLKFWRKVMKV